MVGAVIVFLAVCGLVAGYMLIVHSFLRAAEKEMEEPTSAERHEARRASANALSAESRQPHWAQ
jgi:hypothetical protein